MKSVRGIVLLLLLLALAGGCSFFRNASAKACHSPQAYQKSRTVAPLKIPSGLDAPDTTNALRLPTLNEPPPAPRKGKQPCLDEPPSFKAAPPGKTPQA